VKPRAGRDAIMLKMGDQGQGVLELQRILRAQGFYGGELNGAFDEATLEAIKHFQTTHIGAGGDFLAADGVVGPETEWAIAHPGGDAQKSNLINDLWKQETPQPPIPAGLTPARAGALRYAFSEHKAGVHETPDGSNWGGGIQKYGGRPGWSWCCLFVTWCWRQARVVDFSEPGTYNLLKRAEAKGWFYPLDSTDPRARIPGNALLWQHGDRTGHISLIARVGERSRPAGAPMQYNTIGGNEGNRVKFGIRDERSHGLVGFINPFGPDEQPPDFERGIIAAKSVEGLKTR